MLLKERTKVHLSVKSGTAEKGREFEQRFAPGPRKFEQAGLIIDKK